MNSFARYCSIWLNNFSGRRVSAHRLLFLRIVIKQGQVQRAGLPRLMSTGVRSPHGGCQGPKQTAARSKARGAHCSKRRQGLSREAASHAPLGSALGCRCSPPPEGGCQSCGSCSDCAHLAGTHACMAVSLPPATARVSGGSSRYGCAAAGPASYTTGLNIRHAKLAAECITMHGIITGRGTTYGDGSGCHTPAYSAITHTSQACTQKMV